LLLVLPFHSIIEATMLSNSLAAFYLLLFF